MLAVAFSVIFIADILASAVREAEPLVQHEKETQHSSGLLLMYKFMEDMFAMKNEVIGLKGEISDQSIENKILKEEIRELKSQLAEQKSQLGQQYSQITEQKKTTDILQSQVSNIETNEKKGKIKGKKLQNEKITACAKCKLSISRAFTGCLEQIVVSERNTADDDEPKDSGATYIRWGRTECPPVNGTVKVYEGFAAGDLYNHKGGGVELLCLPEEPTWGEYSDNHIGHAYVYGVEYEISAVNSNRLFGKDVDDQNVPCVVCQSKGRFSVLRIPGRIDCYSGWTEEYSGYLMAEHHGHEKSSDYTCVDSDPEVVHGKFNNENGRLLYPVETYCADDSLSCPPYVDGREMACVVCSK